MECEGGGVTPPRSGSPEDSRRRRERKGNLIEEQQVMSEVHLGCPPHQRGPHISHFTVSIPPRCEHLPDSSRSSEAHACEVDEDGDLILSRRRNSRKDSFVLSIQHNITSTIPKVGLQVWRAELVVADFVLHMTHTSSTFDGITAVELGAGTGLVGMLLARAANTVFITDIGDDVLANCTENINLNADILHRKASLYIRELDWNTSWPPLVNINHSSTQSYNWNLADVAKVQSASLLLAADVIYDDNLTDAFFSMLKSIMLDDPQKVMYLALEKRYNFTIDDLDVVANGYSHFRSYIKNESEDSDDETDWACSFIGRLIDLEEIPQYVQEYDGGKDVELWLIRSSIPQKPLNENISI